MITDPVTKVLYVIGGLATLYLVIDLVGLGPVGLTVFTLVLLLVARPLVLVRGARMFDSVPLIILGAVLGGLVGSLRGPFDRIGLSGFEGIAVASGLAIVIVFGFAWLYRRHALNRRASS
jgi:uncharacterized membrane protein YjdF